MQNLDNGMTKRNQKIKYRTYKVRTVTRLAWTVCVSFALSGMVKVAIGAILKMKGPYALGHGYKGYLLTAPNGEVAVVEERSGRTVGTDLNSVRSKVKSCYPALLDKQVQEARLQSLTIRKCTPDQFWKELSCGESSA